MISIKALALPLLPLLLLGADQLMAAEEPGRILLDEATILRLSKGDSPVNDGLKAAQSGEQVKVEQTRLQYQAQGQLSYSYSDTNEEPIAVFVPKFGPEKAVSLGVTQALPIGLGVGLGVYGSQLSTVDGSINNATQTGLQLEFELDLWKNIFGLIDRAQLESADAKENIAKIKKSIDQRGLELNLRKLYWSLVANQESLALTRQLVKSSEKQLSDAKNRLRLGAADKGDVARNQAQLEGRKSSIHLLDFQREQLVYQLRRLAPELRQQKVSLKPINLDSIVGNVLQCVAKISQQPQANLATTKYAEVLNLLENQYKNDLKVASRTADWDLKLEGGVQTSGVASNFDDSYEDLQEYGRSGYNVSLALSFPLGGTSGRLEQQQKAVTEYAYQSEKKQIETEIYDNHAQVSRSLQLLQQALQAQAISVKSLATSLKSTARKYKQARTSLNNLIFEQDSYFNNSLQEIQTKLSVIHALYDYFKVFTEYPCTQNQLNIQGKI